MSYRYAVFLWAALASNLWPPPLQATPPEEGQVYIVQADDWLSKLAEKFYGDKLAYAVIVEATNARAAADDGYTRIENPDRIEVGQKLFIPAETLAIIPSEESLMSQEVITPGGPSPEQRQLLASLPGRGVPPELFNEIWLNSEPLKLADLRGKVVIVEFWTFG